MKRFVLLLLAFCCITGMAVSQNKITVTPVSVDADAANGGVVYALPQTVVRVKLTARVVVSTAGQFYKYSNRYLGISSVVTENSMRWDLVGAEVSTYGVADPSERYKFSAVGPLPSVALTDDGVLLGVNADVQAPTPMPDATGAEAPAYADLQRVRMPQSVIARTSTAAMAEECANVIFQLRDSRHSIISGDKTVSLPDAGAYRLALSELAKQEADLLSLFVGRRDTFTVVRYVDVVPPTESPKSSLVPIRFSATAGFVDAMDLNGKPVYVDLEIAEATRLSSIPENSRERKSSPIDGLRYRVPSDVVVSVSDRNIRMVQVKIRCSQQGQIATLPSSASKSSVVLSPSTGAIVSITDENSHIYKSKF